MLVQKDQPTRMKWMEAAMSCYRKCNTIIRQKISDITMLYRAYEWVWELLIDVLVHSW